MFSRTPSLQVDDETTPPTSKMSLLDSEGVQTNGGDQEKSQAIGTLGRHSFTDWIIFFGDLLLSLVPLFFIVIDIIAGTLDKKPKSPLGETIAQILLVLPTVFPIVFAALMGKFFKSFALYRAERGVKLGELERLVGCQSLFAAIERQIATRRMTALGVLIILIWALSPVGGQSSLRLISKSPRPFSSTSTIRYLPREAAAFTFMRGEDMASEGWPLFAPLYMTAVQTASTQADSPTDLFGNVKIPDFDTINTGNTTSTDEWISIDSSGNIPYTSLLGIPVAGVPLTGNSTFNLTSRYFAVDCFNVSYVANYSESANYTWSEISSFTLSPPTGNSSGGVLSSDSVLSFGLVSLVNYVSRNTSVSVATCSLSARDVESSIICEDQACHVGAMRKSTTPMVGGPGLITLGNTNMEFAYATVGMRSHAAEGGLASSTMTEQWLVDPNTDFTDFLNFVNISSVDSRVLSTRLRLLYNTFWQTTYGTQYLTGNLSLSGNDYDNAPMETYSATMEDPELKRDTISFNTSEIRISRYDGEVYEFHWTYGVLLFITSAVLLAAGLASLILKSLTLAPDILGYASTNTRDNEFVVLDPSLHQPSYTDGLHRARRLQDLRVIIADVKPESDVGQIAFTVVGEDSKRLRRGRGYV